jgi:TIGR02611 family protein
MWHSTKRISLIVVGFIVLIAGIIMIPYPGPGWAVVFIGLAILANEFVWAEKLLAIAKKGYAAWEKWLTLQHWVIRGIVFLLVCIIVVVTIWLMNGYGFINSWLGLGQDWLTSPFMRG